MERAWNLVRPPPLFESYNVAPTQQVPIIRVGETGRECVLVRWGLIPGWAKDRKIAYSTFNARGETAASKPVFRAAFKRRHCLFPIIGFYEWKRTEVIAGEPSKKNLPNKIPIYIHSADGAQLLLAGLWDRWVDRETGESIDSATILTTGANAFMQRIHDRMPVILVPGQCDQWLSEAQTAAAQRAQAALVGPCDESLLQAHVVSHRVNNARNDDPSNIEPIQAIEAC